MHINDTQTVHTCPTRSVYKPRPLAYIQRLIFEARFALKARPLLVQLRETPRPVFEARLQRLVFKARPLFKEIVLLRFLNVSCRSVTVGFAEKTSVFGSV